LKNRSEKSAQRRRVKKRKKKVGAETKVGPPTSFTVNGYFNFLDELERRVTFKERGKGKGRRGARRGKKKFC